MFSIKQISTKMDLLKDAFPWGESLPRLATVQMSRGKPRRDELRRVPNQIFVPAPEERHVLSLERPISSLRAVESCTTSEFRIYAADSFRHSLKSQISNLKSSACRCYNTIPTGLRTC